MAAVQWSMQMMIVIIAHLHKRIRGLLPRFRCLTVSGLPDNYRPFERYYHVEVYQVVLR